VHAARAQGNKEAQARDHRAATPAALPTAEHVAHPAGLGSGPVSVYILSARGRAGVRSLRTRHLLEHRRMRPPHLQPLGLLLRAAHRGSLRPRPRAEPCSARLLPTAPRLQAPNALRVAAQQVAVSAACMLGQPRLDVRKPARRPNPLDALRCGPQCAN